MQGTLVYQGLTVAEQKNAPISLPAVVAFVDSGSVEVKKQAPLTQAAAVSVQEHPEMKPPEEATHSTASEQELEMSPDPASFIPPMKIAAKTNEDVAATSNRDSHAEPQPEEDREVFVL
jgi:hypothetical protein